MPCSPVEIEKPNFLSEMLDLTKKIATTIPQVRIDWYYTNNQLYFGEITFFDGSGLGKFSPDEWNYTLGSWITLPKKNSL